MLKVCQHLPLAKSREPPRRSQRLNITVESAARRAARGGRRSLVTMQAGKSWQQTSAQNSDREEQHKTKNKKETEPRIMISIVPKRICAC